MMVEPRCSVRQVYARFVRARFNSRCERHFSAQCMEYLIQLQDRGWIMTRQRLPYRMRGSEEARRSGVVAGWTGSIHRLPSYIHSFSREEICTSASVNVNDWQTGPGTIRRPTTQGTLPPSRLSRLTPLVSAGLDPDGCIPSPGRGGQCRIISPNE